MNMREFGRTPGSQFETEKWRKFRRSGKQKILRVKYTFSIFLVSSSIFSPLTESWCNILVKNLSFFGTKFSEPYIFPRYPRNFGRKTHFFLQPSLHIAYL